MGYRVPVRGVVHIARLVPDKRSRSGLHTYALMGAAAGLLLFVSALVHELSHSFVARVRGQTVRGVTLFVLDGFSSTDEPLEPADELLISIVGPLSSLSVAGVFWTIERAWLTPGTPLEGLVAYLALINLLLGAFNMLPCLPPDGGRVLRAFIWRYTGSRVHATRITAGAGQLLAMVFIGLGLSQVIAGQTFNGIWLGVIGWPPSSDERSFSKMSRRVCAGCASATSWILALPTLLPT